MSNPHLVSAHFSYFLAYFLLCHLIVVFFPPFSIIRCLLVNLTSVSPLVSSLILIWLHLVLSPLNAIPLLVSSPSLVFMYFCRPLFLSPVNKSCSSLRSLCPWFLSPCGLWKVQNCHCLQTVLCVTPPCQHSFFWAQSGLSLIPVHPLVWPHLSLSLSLSLTSPSSQLASTLTQLPSQTMLDIKSLSITHAV